MSGSAPENIKSINSLKRRLVFLFTAFCAVIILGALAYHHSYKQDIEKEKEDLLASIARVKVDEILNWRRERLLGLISMLDSPVLGAQLKKLAENPGDGETAELLGKRLEAFIRNNRYRAAVLVDGTGKMAVSAGMMHKELSAEGRAMLALAKRADKPLMGDIRLGEKDEPVIHMAALAVKAASGLRLYLVVGLAPGDHLYPLIREWPVRSATAETLLLRRDGDSVLFLSELRHIKNSAMKLSIPLNGAGLTASMAAAAGGRGILHAVDYNGRRVLAYAAPVDGLNWVLVAKVDEAEVFADQRRTSVLLLLLVLAVLAAGGAGMYIVFSLLTAEYARRLAAAESETEKYRLDFEMLNESAADMMIIADVRARALLFVSRSACETFGYTREEMLRLKPEDLIPPENIGEFNRRFKALASGKREIYETVHLRKDGGRVHMEISATGVRHNGRDLVYFICRDITEKKKVAAELRDLESVHSSVVENARDVIVFLQDGKMKFFNRRLAELLGYSREELAGRDFLEAVAPEDRELVAKRYADRMAGREVPPLYEFSFRRKDGALVPVELCASKVDYHGRPADLCVMRDIADRKKAEAALKESEVLYSSLIENAFDGVIIVQDGQLILGNKKLHEMLGYKPGSLAGRRLEDIVTGSSKATVLQNYSDRAAGRPAPGIYEAKFAKAGGGTLEAEISAAIVSYKGQPANMAIVRDITERKIAEAALRESEALYSSLIKDARDGIIFIQNETIIFGNERMAELLGYSREEFSGMSFLEIVPASEHAKVIENYTSRMAGQPAKAIYEVEMLRKDGSTLQAEVSPSVVNYRGFPADMAIFRDITERKKAEKALKDSEALYSSIIENARDGIIFIQDERVLFASRSMAAMLGCSAEELSGKSLYELFAAREKEKVRFNYTARMAGRAAPAIYELALLRGDGTELETEVSPSVVPYKGRPADMAVFRDITERKKAEAAIRASEQKYRSIFENVQDVFIQTGLDGKIIEISPSVERYTGYKRGEMIGRDTSTLYAVPEERENLLAELKEKGEVTSYEVALRTKDGSIVHAAVNARLARDGAGEPVMVEGSIRDVTGRRLAEAALRESEGNFRTFFETMRDLVFVGDAGGMISHVSPSVARRLGYTPAELKKMSMLDVYPAELRAEARQIFASVTRGERADCPLPLAARNGTLIPADTHIWRGKWDGKDCVFSLSKDLGEEQEAQQRFERLFRNNPALMALSSVPERTFFDVNNSFLAELGYTREEVIGKTAAELNLFPEPEKQAMLAAGLSSEGSMPQFELKVRRKDGRILYGLFSGDAIISQGKKYLLTVMVDITARKRAEEELKTSEEQFRQLVENAPEAIFIQSGGKFVYLNQACCRIFGAAAPEQLIGADFMETLSPECREAVRERLRFQRETGKAAPLMEQKYLRLDGKPVEVETTAIAMTFRGRQSHLVFMRDITERKKAEVELRASEEKFQTAFKLAPLMISLGSVPEGILLDVNDRYCEFHGMSRDAIIGHNSVELGHLTQESDNDIRAALKRAGRVENMEIKALRKDGGTNYYSYSGAMLSAGGKRLVMGVADDITESKAAAEKIKASLAEKEVLLKEIHHRVKNNLQVVSSLLNLQSRSIKDRTALIAMTESRSRVKAMALVHEILYRSKDLARMDMREYIGKLLDSLASSHRSSSQLSVSREICDCSLDVDMAVSLGLILNELVTNSLKHAFAGGRSGRLDVKLSGAQGGYLLSVRDDGPGLPVDFDAAAAKTLGMQLVYMLAKQISGGVEIKPGPGTHIEVRFPG